jgi:hypothetical protein
MPSDIEKVRLLEELGRTQTVKDAQAAYLQIWEAQRRLAVKWKHHRQNQQRLNAEVETFLDDLCDITGLKPNSPLFASIVSLTIAKRLARRGLQNEYESSLTNFPNGW